MTKIDKKHWAIFLIVVFIIGGLLICALNSFSISTENHFVAPPKKDVKFKPQKLDLDFDSDNKKIDTSNWNVYRNEEYGFEFDYPQNWKLDEDYVYTGDSKAISLRDPEEPSGVNPPVISFEYENVRLNKNFELSESLIDFINSTPDVVVHQRDDISNRESYQVEFWGHLNAMGFIILHNESIFQMVMVNAYYDSISLEEKYILNSLKLF